MGEYDEDEGYDVDEGYDAYVDADDDYDDEYEAEFDFLSNGEDASSSLSSMNGESAEFSSGFLSVVALCALVLLCGVVCCASVGLRRRRKKMEPNAPEQHYQQQALAMSD